VLPDEPAKFGHGGLSGYFHPAGPSAALPLIASRIIAAKVADAKFIAGKIDVSTFTIAKIIAVQVTAPKIIAAKIATTEIATTKTDTADVASAKIPTPQDRPQRQHLVERQIPQEKRILRHRPPLEQPVQEHVFLRGPGRDLQPSAQVAKGGNAERPMGGSIPHPGEAPGLDPQDPRLGVTDDAEAAQDLQVERVRVGPRKCPTGCTRG
jgi:hypothetical protein